MNNRNIKEEKTELIKTTILEAAKEIVEESGFKKLSIRKLAKKVGYSPGNIYQYFDSKDQIIKELVQKGYKEIIKSLSLGKEKFPNVEAEIKIKFRKYIESALENKYYYKSVMLSSDPDILNLTSILNINQRNDNLALKKLELLLKKGQKTGEFKNMDAQIQAQVIWTATFGLVIRMILEKITNKNKQNELIKNHFNLLFKGIKKDGV